MLGASAYRNDIMRQAEHLGGTAKASQVTVKAKYVSVVSPHSLKQSVAIEKTVVKWG